MTCDESAAKKPVETTGPRRLARTAYAAISAGSGSTVKDSFDIVGSCYEIRTSQNGVMAPLQERRSYAMRTSLAAAGSLNTIELALTLVGRRLGDLRGPICCMPYPHDRAPFS